MTPDRAPGVAVPVQWDDDAGWSLKFRQATTAYLLIWPRTAEGQALSEEYGRKFIRKEEY